MKEMTEISFDDMKKEFLVMDQEIQEKAAIIDSLMAELEAKKRALADREESSLKMVDQMEELHENLAELDVRFERMEEQNAQLKQEKEDARKEMENEMKDLKVSVERRSYKRIEEVQTDHLLSIKQKEFLIQYKCKVIAKLEREKKNGETELSTTRLELSNTREDLEKHKQTTQEKIKIAQKRYKETIERAVAPLSAYLEKNKGSKNPVKKTKGYRLLKTAESDLKSALTLVNNNNNATEI